MQHSIYASLKAFMAKIGYNNESEARADDSIWPTRLENAYRAMMEYVFGVPRHEISVPTKMQDIHPAILEHPEFEVIEHPADEGVEVAAPAPAPVAPPVEAPAPTAPPVEAPAPAPAAPEVVKDITQQFEQQQQETTAPAPAPAPAAEQTTTDASTASTEEQSQQEQPAQEGSSEKE